MARVRNLRDLLAGLLFAAFGVVALVISRAYEIGAASRMGPGYFPRMLGLLLVVLGAALALRGFWPSSEAQPRWRWRPLLVVLAGVASLHHRGAAAGPGRGQPAPRLHLLGGERGVPVEGGPGQRRHPGRRRGRGLRLRAAHTTADLAGLPRGRPVMELLDNLALGLSVALTPINLIYAFVGVLVGTLIGVLPGIGPVATIAMLLPTTYGLPPVTALIMLAGIYYGASFGGSTTAILVNLPGEMSSVITVLDGHQMAQAGPGRVGAVHRGPGLVLRRQRGDPADCRLRAAPGRPRAQVRRRRIFLADGAGPRVGRGDGGRLGAQGRADDHPRPAAGRRREWTSTRASRASPSTCRS